MKLIQNSGVREADHQQEVTVMRSCDVRRASLQREVQVRSAHALESYGGATRGQWAGLGWETSEAGFSAAPSWAGRPG